jgi:hypothetical protein
MMKVPECTSWLNKALITKFDRETKRKAGDYFNAQFPVIDESTKLTTKSAHSYNRYDRKGFVQSFLSSTSLWVEPLECAIGLTNFRAPFTRALVTTRPLHSCAGHCRGRPLYVQPTAGHRRTIITER